MIQLPELGRVPLEPLKSSDHCSVKPEIDGTAVIIGARTRIVLDRKVVARIVKRVRKKGKRISCEIWF